MPKELKELYKYLETAKIFSFELGSDFKKNLLGNNKDFPVNGIYLMFEEGETCNNQNRIVRIGINKRRLLVDRLNKHLNGSMGVSVFRRHLWRILAKNNNKDIVTDYIKNKIKFCIISGPDDQKKREELESKIIGTISNCKDCQPSSSWLGLKSESRKIRESGLWNVQHVFSENSLDDKDLEYIKKRLL